MSKVYKQWENRQPKEAQTDLGEKRHLDVCSPTLLTEELIPKRHQVAQGPIQVISQHSQ